MAPYKYNSPGNSPGNSAGALHLVNGSAQSSSSPFSSVTGREDIGLEDQLLVREEVHLSSSPFLQVFLSASLYFSKRGAY